MCLNWAAEISSILESGAEIQEGGISHQTTLDMEMITAVSLGKHLAPLCLFCCENMPAWDLICICSCSCAFVVWCIWRKQLYVGVNKCFPVFCSSISPTCFCERWKCWLYFSAHSSHHGFPVWPQSAGRHDVHWDSAGLLAGCCVCTHSQVGTFKNN